MSRAFDRLDPALQYQVAYGLGFDALRPVQELTIDAVLDDQNVVVLAPTAGGKTEAAFLPLLSRVVAENWPAPSILYITPIKALINNQEERLSRLTAMVGRRAFKWHGDVGASRRRAFLREPADVLLTTPESIEAMLISRRVPSEIMFGNLRAVVIDEVHAFAGDDRGGHLSSVLERVTRFAGRDLQRIGLSATVGNPQTILEWQQGSSRRGKALVDPPRSSSTPRIELDFVGTLENAALVIERLHRGKKRLVFADSRRKVEALGKLLDERGVRAFVMHSSLSMAERSLAEREFAEGQNCVIVATSAMELGIDVGDLDHVLQVDSPPTVASFLQRMGRTGRRSGTTPNCTVLCTKEDQLLQAAGVLRLHGEGYVEPVRPVVSGAHLFAHQVLALSLQEGGMGRDAIDHWLGQAAPLARVAARDRDEVLRHLLDEALLTEIDGQVVFGPAAEKRYGAMNFLQLYAVFETTRDYKVFHGRNEIGEVSPLWVAQKGHSGTEFTLGGKPWEIRAVDHTRRRLDVVRGKTGGKIGWIGRPRALGFDLCQAMEAVLRGDHRSPLWTDRAATQLEVQRDAFADVPSDGIQRYAADYQWHTFAGAGANSILARLVERELGCETSFDNLCILIPGGAGAHDVHPGRAVAAVLRRACEFDERDLTGIGATLDPDMLGKFAPCLPAEQLARTLAGKFLDLDGVRRLAARSLGLPGASE